MAKISVYHFHNGSGGGVLSVIRNLLRYRQHSKIENHVIYTINKDQIPTFFIPSLEAAVSERVFYYSPKWNFYYTCSQLSKLLPDEKAVIVAHDWLELGMVSNLGLKNPVVQILHGDFDFYYQSAYKHNKHIDKLISVSHVIADKLKILLPDMSNRIHYLKYPTPIISNVKKNFDEIHCAYFVRDLTDERKQSYLLPIIEKELLKLGVQVVWHIAGGGMSYGDYIKLWSTPTSDRIHFYGLLNPTALGLMLKNCNIMILPSLSEGFPVSVVEAMKYGLVCLTSKWNGAVDGLLEHGVTGYYFENSDAEGYANCIKMLLNNKQIFESISKSALLKAAKIFDPVKNTIDYEKIFIDASLDVRSNKTSFKAYGSRLDQPWIPNKFVYYLRRLIS